MRMADTLTNEIAKDWLDFPLIYDIFSRYKFIWVKNNVYKKWKPLVNGYRWIKPRKNQM